MISIELTGHMYFNSSYESCSNCGTCNGARCESCKKSWVVSGVDGRFYSYTDAQAAEAKMSELVIYSGKSYNDISGYTVKDGVLHGLIWVSKHDVTEGALYGDLCVPCNKDASIYEEKLAETLDNMKKFEECKCVDKNQSDCGNSCDVTKCCTDERCYYEMKNHGRTERKWYM